MEKYKHIVDFIHNEYVDKLFTKTDDKSIRMANDVIKHEAFELERYELTDSEVKLIKQSLLEKIYDKIEL